MLQKVWECSQNGFGSMRTNRNSLEMYVKNPFSRIRVWLSMGVVSQTQICLIYEHANKCGGKEKYSSVRYVIDKVDRLVDICNNTDMSMNIKDVKC